MRYYREAGVRGGTGPSSRGVDTQSTLEAAWEGSGAESWKHAPPALHRLRIAPGARFTARASPGATHTQGRRNSTKLDTRPGHVHVEAMRNTHGSAERSAVFPLRPSRVSLSGCALPPFAGRSFPTWRDAFWLPADAYYWVLEGVALFGAAGARHTTGDVFWARAGAVHGPVLNGGNSTLRIALVSAVAPLARFATDAPSDGNPTVNGSLGALRSYREANGTWEANPSPHTAECTRNGGVQNMAFEQSGTRAP